MNKWLKKHFLRRQIIYTLEAAVIDVLIILTAYLAAFSARSVLTPLEYNSGLKLVAFSTLLTISIFYAFGIYHRIWSRTSGHDVTVIVNAVGLSTFVVVIFDVILDPRPLPLSIILIANALSLAGFIAVRYRSRLISGASWRWKAVWHEKFPRVTTRVLIVGAGQSGQELALRLKHHTNNNHYTVVGFVDDDAEKWGMYVEGCRVLGNRHDLTRLVEDYDIDLIVVALHNISGPDFREILTLCENTKARIKVVPNFLAQINANRDVALLRDVEPEDLLGRGTISRHEDVDMTPVIGKTVLVTGAAGSIGSELARQMPTYNPVKLIVLDSNESGLHDLCIELATKFPGLELVQVLADITNREALIAVFARHRPQIVFHAAAYKHVPILQMFPNEAVRVNIGGTRNLAELARDFQVERFVLISTDKAVNPSSVMGASKRVCELLMQAFSEQKDHKTLFTAVRFGNVLGSRGSVVPTFNQQISSGGPVTITHPEMTRYFMTIPEAVNLVIHAACLTRGREIFLLKMGEVVRIVDLAERMIRLRGLRPYKDIDIKFTGVRPGEKLHEQLYDGTERNAVETLHPGIIQLDPRHDRHFSNSDLLNWVKSLLNSGLDSSSDPLKQLLWGLTASEEYALSVQSDKQPADGVNDSMMSKITDNGWIGADTPGMVASSNRVDMTTNGHAGHQ